MTPPTGPREDEPLDGSVRHLLWRLRARLVTPPSEERVRADLDRLVSAAREQAHEAPSAGATSRPADAVGDASPASRPDHPVPHGPVGVPTDPAARGVAGFRRRWSATRVMGRVAAAAVMIVAVATGVAGARDGSVTLTALLGRGDTATPEPVVETPELAIPPSDDADDEVAEPPEADERDDVSPDAGAAVPEAPEPEPTPEPELEEDDLAPPSDSPDGDGSSDDSSAERSGDADVEPPAEDGDELLAAPEPEDVDGFGGPRPCEEADLADCLPADEEEDASEDADGGDEGGPAEPTDRESEDEAEKLAQRRFRPSDEDESTAS